MSQSSRFCPSPANTALPLLLPAGLHCRHGRHREIQQRLISAPRPDQPQPDRTLCCLRDRQHHLWTMEESMISTPVHIVPEPSADLLNLGDST